MPIPYYLLLITNCIKINLTKNKLMPESYLSRTICTKGSDGEYYRHAVKYTPPDHVTITKTERSWLFWKKEVQAQVGLTKTEGSLWWKKTVPNQEALDILEEHVHAVALAHMTRYGKDFQQTRIDEHGATFDKQPVQPHTFSVVEDPFRKKLVDTSSSSTDSKFREYVSKHFTADYLKDVQGTHLFNRFANQPLPAYLPLPLPKKSADICPPPSGPSSPRISPLSSSSSRGSDSPSPPPPEDDPLPPPRADSPAHVSVIESDEEEDDASDRSLSPRPRIDRPASPVQPEIREEDIPMVVNPLYHDPRPPVDKAEEAVALNELFRRQLAGEQLTAEERARIAAIRSEFPS